MMEIGTKTWFKGEELTITSAPYSLYGGMWQDGVTSTGKTVTIPTPEQHKENTKSKQHAWSEQQRQFSKLAKRKLNNERER